MVPVIISQWLWHEHNSAECVVEGKKIFTVEERFLRTARRRGECVCQCMNTLPRFLLWLLLIPNKGPPGFRYFVQYDISHLPDSVVCGHVIVNAFILEVRVRTAKNYMRFLIRNCFLQNCRTWPHKISIKYISPDDIAGFEQGRGNVGNRISTPTARHSGWTSKLQSGTKFCA